MIFCRDRGFLKDLKQKGNQTFFVFLEQATKYLISSGELGQKWNTKKCMYTCMQHVHNRKQKKNLLQNNKQKTCIISPATERRTFSPPVSDAINQNLRSSRAGRQHNAR